jgi:hydroxymethylglutaryl-CoA lyase
VEKQRIRVNEVAPRDGLQNEPAVLPTERKIALIDALSRTGVAKIEATSFVSPRRIPALADAEAVMRGITRQPGVTYTALVANERGMERALTSGVDEVNLVMSVSETHNLLNLRRTRDQSAQELERLVRTAHVCGMPVTVSLSCAFGCPIEGDVTATTRTAWVSRFVDHGVRSIALCDTTGMAFPSQVGEVTAFFRDRWPDVALTLHFHNTRGMALANVVAAVLAGAYSFDASLGGLGGCPYAPGASGNVCTEDMVHMLNLMGYAVGVDLDALLACSGLLSETVGHALSGHTAMAGPRSRLHPAPSSLAAIRARALSITHK